MEMQSYSLKGAIPIFVEKESRCMIKLHLQERDSSIFYRSRNNTFYVENRSRMKIVVFWREDSFDFTCSELG